MSDPDTVTYATVVNALTTTLRRLGIDTTDVTAVDFDITHRDITITRLRRDSHSQTQPIVDGLASVVTTIPIVRTTPAEVDDVDG